VLQIARDTSTSPDDANQMVVHLRAPLTHGPVAVPDPAQDTIRYRTVDLLGMLLKSTIAGFEASRLVTQSIHLGSGPRRRKKVLGHSRW
jgi:hypothetical protein